MLTYMLIHAGLCWLIRCQPSVDQLSHRCEPGEPGVNQVSTRWQPGLNPKTNYPETLNEP
jgi:hypothetical protein